MHGEKRRKVAVRVGLSVGTAQALLREAERLGTTRGDLIEGMAVEYLRGIGSIRAALRRRARAEATENAQGPERAT